MTFNSGDNVYGMDWPASQYDQDWTGLYNLSNTTLEDGDPSCAVNITAPTSGRVFVALGAGVRNNAATTDQVLVTFEVRQDAAEGTVHMAADIGLGVESVGVGGEEFHYGGNFALVEDLTPGRSYYIVVQHQVTGGSTCDIVARNLLVFPVP